MGGRSSDNDTRNDRSGRSARDKRKHRRYRSTQPAGMQLGQVSGVVEVVNLSIGGATCRISTGFAPFEGDDVELTLADGTRRSGRVAWTSGHEFGLAFDYAMDDPGSLSHIETWSGDNYATLLKVQSRLRKTRQ